MAHVVDEDVLAETFGLDISSQVIEQFRAKLPKATGVRGSILNADFEDGFFDAVFPAGQEGVDIYQVTTGILQKRYDKSGPSRTSPAITEAAARLREQNRPRPARRLSRRTFVMRER